MRSCEAGVVRPEAVEAFEDPRPEAEFHCKFVSSPGSRASTVHPCTWWFSCFRVAHAFGGSFSHFARSFHRRLAISPGVVNTAVIWPMPLPFPKELGVVPSERSGSEQAALRRGVNFAVLLLNWLHLRRPSTCPAEITIGAGLNKLQWRVVRNLERLMVAWSTMDAVDSTAMGRTAAKIEEMEDVLSRLTAFESSSQDWLVEVSPPSSGSSRVRSSVPGLQKAQPCAEVGLFGRSEVMIARPITADQVDFRGRPSFDPVPYLDEKSKFVYCHPLQAANSPESCPFDPPRVRIHASESEKWRLLKKLDESFRLGVVPVEKALIGYQAGLFSVVKDASKDRLIFDSRPFNGLEGSPGPWSTSMASANNLVDLFLEPEDICAVSGTDLRDFYHAFLIGPERLIRNTLVGAVNGSQLRGFNCFDPELAKPGQKVFLALKTLAMGDHHAVSLAQVAHLSILARAGVLRGTNFVSMNLALPRGPDLCGVVIDDLCLFESIARSSWEAGLKKLNSVESLDKALSAYEGVGLTSHPGKTFRGEVEADFWGCTFDGRIGLIRASLKRTIPVVYITLGVLKLGYCSISLLEVLLGCWTSIFLFRRRLLSIFQACYGVVHSGSSRQTVVKLSEDVKIELLLCLGLAPLAVTDMRARPAEQIYASDASTWGIGVTRAPLPVWMQKEVHRHRLRKTVWTRLLSPLRAHLRIRGELPAADELPEGRVLPGHPLWILLSTGLSFEEVCRERSREGLHINVLELRALIRSEREAIRCGFPCRVFNLSDSQVALGASLKGRSASVGLNQELQQSLAFHLGCALYSNSGYIPSEVNTADDPTRHLVVRGPSVALPEWMLSNDEQSGLVGLDSWLAEYGVTPYELSGLPPFEELFGEASEDLHVWRKTSRRSRQRKGLLVSPLLESQVNESRVEEQMLRDDFPSTGPNSTFVDGGLVFQESSSNNFMPCASSLGRRKLSESAQEVLRKVKRSQIHVPKAWGRMPEDWVPDFPGYLDLYSGKKGVAKAVAQLGNTWAICFELEDDPEQDVLLPETVRSSNHCLRLKRLTSSVRPSSAVVSRGPSDLQSDQDSFRWASQISVLRCRSRSSWGTSMPSGWLA